ncbi:MAG: glycosyltransferase [Dysgonamonadaceae bacterium]|jgi:GT2 family glycosyltransferase|nr:glycosyltransferase [Dysgonamonadaceae bacterium]
MKLPNSFSIIVLYHSGKSHLKVCLDSLINTVRKEDEIIVIVNNVDEKEHSINFYENRIKYFHFYENLGHGKAANIGVEKAENEYVIISDHDLVFLPSWLENLWHFYSSDADLKAVSCKIIDVLHNNILDFGIASSEYNFAHPHLGLPINHPLVQKDRYAQMICTGGFLINKTDFLLVNGFNADFGTLYTDLDICLKLKKAGYKVGAASKAIALHFGSDLAQSALSYKRSHLKADVKGVFMKNNASVITNDLIRYYEDSFYYFNLKHAMIKEFFFCNCITVVNYTWYEELLKELGIKSLGSVYHSYLERDVNHINLFGIWGYNIMALGSPIAYFVDIFSSIKSNAYWWQERANKNDIVIDRNANILTVKDIL